MWESLVQTRREKSTAKDPENKAFPYFQAFFRLIEVFLNALCNIVLSEENNF